MKRAAAWSSVLAALLVWGALASNAAAQLGGGDDESWNAIPAGGEGPTPGSFSFGATVGQYDAVVLTGGPYVMVGGFWAATVDQYPTGVDLEPAPARFALRGFASNPSYDAARILFSLADAEPAYLELVDVAGRRCWEARLTSPSPGDHALAVDVRLAPGLYFMQLKQGSRSATARAVVLSR